MIVTIPVAYRASVIHPGRRKSEECLLVTEAGVRIPDADPEIAVLIHPDLGRIASEARYASQIAHSLMSLPNVTLYKGDGHLLGGLRLPGLPADAPGIQVEFFRSFILSCLGRPSSRGLFDAYRHPFQRFGVSEEMMAYHENGDFKQVSSPPGAREEAIAHAAAFARRCAALPDGRVVVPVPSPRLMVSHHSAVLNLAPNPQGSKTMMYGLEEIEQARTVTGFAPNPSEFQPLHFDVRWLPDPGKAMTDAVAEKLQELTRPQHPAMRQKEPLEGMLQALRQDIAATPAIEDRIALMEAHAGLIMERWIGEKDYTCKAQADALNAVSLRWRAGQERVARPDASPGPVARV